MNISQDRTFPFVSKASSMVLTFERKTASIIPSIKHYSFIIKQWCTVGDYINSMKRKCVWKNDEVSKESGISSNGMFFLTTLLIQISWVFCYSVNSMYNCYMDQWTLKSTSSQVFFEEWNKRCQKLKAKLKQSATMKRNNTSNNKLYIIVN